MTEVSIEEPDDQSSLKKMIDCPDKMCRVDWRWAVAKGFLDKETHKWNEAMGGQEAYLRQRNERMIAR